MLKRFLFITNCEKMGYLVIISLLQAAYGQLGHWYGFSPVCVLWWVDRWSDRENTWPHVRQVYGLIPVCNRMCRVSMSDRAKVRLQRSHICDKRLPLSVDRDLCRDAMCLAKRSPMVKIWKKPRRIRNKLKRFID